MKPTTKAPSRVGLVLHWFVRRFFPELAMTRQESMEALKHLNEKLRKSRDEVKSWRDRAHTTEAAFANSIRFAKEEARKCDGVRWRLY